MMKIDETGSRLSALRNAIDDAVVETNEWGTIVAANLAAERMLSDTGNTLIGKSIAAVIPQYDAAQFVDQADGISRQIKLLSAGGKFVQARIAASPIVNFCGRRNGAYLIIKDVTPKADLERASLIIRQTPLVLFELVGNPPFEWAYLSPNVIQFGYTPEDCLSGDPRFEEMVHEADRASLAAALRDMLEAKVGTYDQDLQLRAKDGAFRWVHARLLAIPDPTSRGTTIRGTLFDVTERIEAACRTSRLNRTLKTISAGNAALVRAQTEPALLSDTCKVLVSVGGYMVVWIALIDSDPERTIRPAAACGNGASYVAELRLDWHDEGPVGTALRTGTPQVNRDYATNPKLEHLRGICLRRGFGSSAAFPLMNGPSPLGAIVMVSGQTDAFDADEMALLDELAKDLAYGIRALRLRQNHDRLTERLQQSMEATIGAIAGIIEVRDPYTAGHQRRVARLAVAIALKIGLPEHRIHGLHLASTIHDVGKIAVPTEIINKPGALSAPEFELVKQHVEVGYQIVRDIDLPWPVGQMILQHHERLDGSGYPTGLAGDSILTEARIIAVADVVDAMHSFRPYRPALGIEKALAEISAFRGSKYDPDVVDACVSLFRDEEFDFK